ncbi:hypothetical protein FQR65_LT19599 [Abscondita terminalis]|nr:hypothetical protein FQR65_LT19599 [Abscondita terminalis]
MHHHNSCMAVIAGSFIKKQPRLDVLFVGFKERADKVVGDYGGKWVTNQPPEDPRIPFEMYDAVPDVDGAIPGGSTNPGIQVAATPTSSSSPTSTTHSSSHRSSNKKSLKPIEIFAKINTE